MNNMLIIGKNKGKIKILKRNLAFKFKRKNLEPAQYFLEVKIIRNRKKGIIFLCQNVYIDKILKRFKMKNCRLINILITADVNEFIILYDNKITIKKIDLYGLKVDSKIYLAVHIRPDIAYTIFILSRFLSNPSPQYMKTADRVLYYL